MKIIAYLGSIHDTFKTVQYRLFCEHIELISTRRFGRYMLQSVVDVEAALSMVHERVLNLFYAILF